MTAWSLYVHYVMLAHRKTEKRNHIAASHVFNMERLSMKPCILAQMFFFSLLQETCMIIDLY